MFGLSCLDASGHYETQPFQSVLILNTLFSVGSEVANMQRKVGGDVFKHVGNCRRLFRLITK